MVIIIGFYILITVIAFIASAIFGAYAVSKGYSPGRAKKYPFYIAGGAVFLNVLGQTILSFFSQNMMALLFICWGSLVVLVMTAILVLAYKNMRTAPDADTRKPAGDQTTKNVK